MMARWGPFIRWSDGRCMTLSARIAYDLPSSKQARLNRLKSAYRRRRNHR